MLRKQMLVVVLFALAGLLSCDAKEEHQAATESHAGHEPGQVRLTARQLQLMNITFGRAQKRQLEGYLSAPARVEAVPGHLADVGTLISGRVSKIYVAEGERVQRGQVVLEIQGLEIGEIKGEFIRSRAALESARANFERQQTLLAEDIAARRSFIEAQTAFDIAKASFSAADQRLHSIGITDDEAEELIALVSGGDGQTRHTGKMISLKITSPISGIVGHSQVKVGQHLQPDMDVMEVVNYDEVWVVADIYEKNLEGVRPGQRVTVVTEAYPDSIFDGVLSYLSPVVNENSRAIEVRTTIDNRAEVLRLGMFATMRVFDESSRESLTVPDAAVQNDGDADFVFIQVVPEVPGELDKEHSEGKVFQKLPVQVGLRQDGYAQILAGLSGDESLVTSGAFFLKSEMMKESFGGHGH